MEIDQRVLYLFVAEKLLDREEVYTLFQQMSGETVAESVNADRLCDLGFFFER